MKKTTITILIIVILTICYAVDNNSWRSYTNTTHIHDFTVENSKLYIATWGGLVEYTIQSAFTRDNCIHQKTYNNIDGLSTNDLRTVTYDNNSKSVWMSAYNEGINTLDESNRVTLIDQDKLGLLSNKVTSVLLDDYFYVATNAGLCIYNSYEGLSFPLLMSSYDEELISSNIRDMIMTDDNYLVLGTSSGVNYVHRDSLDYSSAWHSWTFENSLLPSNDVTSISSRNGYIAIGTNKGAMIVSGFPTKQHYNVVTRIEEMNQPPVSTIYIDEENQIWLSLGIWDEDTMSYQESSDYALCKLNSTGNVLFTYKTGENGLITKDIRRIKEFEGKLCLATWGEGLLIFDEGKWEQLAEDCIGFNSIKSISTDNNNTLWFCAGTWGDSKTKKGTRGVSSFDGEKWITYNVKNSQINSDNINTIAVDSENRKWFGAWSASSNNEYGWVGGISILDDSGDDNVWYRLLPGNVSIYDVIEEDFVLLDNNNGCGGSTIPYIMKDSNDNIIVNCYDVGLSVYSPNATNDYKINKIRDVRIDVNDGQKVTYSIQSRDRYYFAVNRTLEDNGKVYYWEGTNPPEVDSLQYWNIAEIPELRNCTMNAMETFIDSFGRSQTWFATNTGLFTYISSNGTDKGWYKWGTNIKRERWNGYSWYYNQSDLYYEDEERLFGSNEAETLSLFFDPFGRLWIGSNGHGMSSFDPYSERFTNYSVSNTKMISNDVTDFGYDPVSGRLFVGSSDGLSSFIIGVTQNEQKEFIQTIAYPNPYYPDETTTPLMIVNSDNKDLANSNVYTFPDSYDECRIYDTGGDLVVTLNLSVEKRFTWDGTNKAGNKCSSGIYFYVITGSGDVAKGKIALIR